MTPTVICEMIWSVCSVLGGIALGMKLREYKKGNSNTSSITFNAILVIATQIVLFTFMMK